MISEVEYLGHVSEAEGLKSTPQILEAFVNALRPVDFKQIRNYIGLINYLPRFLPSLSSILRLLYDLLAANTTWRWQQEEENAFQKRKELLTSA